MSPLPFALETVDRCLACGSERHQPYLTTPAHMHQGDETFDFSQCQDCGLVFLNPRVPPSELGRYYRDSYLPYRGPEAWGRYAPLVERDLRRTDQARVKVVKKHVPLSPHEVVLDVGCGKPSFLQRLLAQTGCQGIGTDFTDSGWRDGSYEFSGLTLLEGDIHDLALPARPHAITMWHYLEHDYDPARTLRVLAEQARPGASLFIEVPNLEAWTRRWQGKYWEGFHAPRHTALYTPQTLRGLLQRNGWNVVQQYPSGTLDPYAVFWMGQMERQGIDWQMNMEKKFPGFVAGMILTAPLFALQRFIPLAVMTCIAQKA
jgi:SAM-dependent methyltransferase